MTHVLATTTTVELHRDEGLCLLATMLASRILVAATGDSPPIPEPSPAEATNDVFDLEFIEGGRAFA